VRPRRTREYRQLSVGDADDRDRVRKLGMVVLPALNHEPSTLEPLERAFSVHDRPGKGRMGRLRRPPTDKRCQPSSWGCSDFACISFSFVWPLTCRYDLACDKNSSALRQSLRRTVAGVRLSSAAALALETSLESADW